jgi:hypothetical protein
LVTVEGNVVEWWLVSGECERHGSHPGLQGKKENKGHLTKYLRLLQKTKKILKRSIGR